MRTDEVELRMRGLQQRLEVRELRAAIKERVADENNAIAALENASGSRVSAGSTLADGRPSSRRLRTP